MKDLNEFKQYMLQQNLSSGTIKDYLYELKKVPNGDIDQEVYLIQNNHKRMLIAAWRKYLKFQKSIGKINNLRLLDELDKWKLPKTRGKTNSGNWFPQDDWGEIISKAPNRCAKMAIWIGFQFGLRLNEILHLRIVDVDLENNRIHIQKHKEDKSLNQESWHPKHFHLRSIPIAPKQKLVLERWINELPGLDHPYLLYSPKNKKRVQPRNLQRWCKTAQEGLKVHDMRRSFAQNLYEKSEGDTKLVQLLMGHSNISTTSSYLGISDQQAYEKYVQAMS